jgi:hypothetical protein
MPPDPFDVVEPPLDNPKPMPLPPLPGATLLPPLDDEPPLRPPVLVVPRPPEPELLLACAEQPSVTAAASKSPIVALVSARGFIADFKARGPRIRKLLCSSNSPSSLPREFR